MSKSKMVLCVIGLSLLSTASAYGTIGSGTLVDFWSCDLANDTGTGALGDTANAQWCGSGGTAYDATPVGMATNPATRTAGPDGIADSAVQITGASGGGTGGYSTAQTNLGTTFTFEMMLRYDSTPYRWAYFTNRAGGPVVLAVGTAALGNAVQAVIGGSAAASGITWAPTSGAWYQVAVTGDGTTASLYITPYGQAVTTPVGTWACSVPASSANGISLGNIDGSRYGMVGYIDWAAAWNVALTPEELTAQNLTNTPIPTAPNPQPSFHPGDINGDGTVDLQDFGTLKDNFGATEGAVWATGDISGDGAVDLQDFGILKDHFGHTDGDSSVNAVPEPATMSLLALAGLAVLRRRK